MKRFQALAFDFDGVMADTVAVHTEARLQAFSQLGYDTSPALHDEAHRHGSHPPEIIGWILKQIGVVAAEADVLVDATVQKVCKLKNDIYRQQAAIGLPAVVGAVEFVRRAGALYEPQQLAIATTASREHEVLPFLKRYELMDQFGIIVAKEDTPPQRMKPDSFVYIEAAKLLHVSPESVAAFEDSPRGQESAKAAGSYVIGITTTHSRQDLLPLADVVYDRFDQMDEAIAA